jgi:hypothetical protein
VGDLNLSLLGGDGEQHQPVDLGRIGRGSSKKIVPGGGKN